MSRRLLTWLRQGISRGAAAGYSQGRQPLEKAPSWRKPQRGDRSLSDNSPAAPTGLVRFCARRPGADAPGYNLPSLRD